MAPVDWEHTERTDGHNSAQALYGRWRVSAWDWKRSELPVCWYVHYEGIFFGGIEGRARTMDEGKAAALAAADAEEAKLTATLLEQQQRRDGVIDG